ncbi:MAG: Lin0512 family protein [Burkholderiaceae bacterium]
MADRVTTSEKRIILEMGTGNDLYGGDYTKAACRAVHDALHHSSITLFRSLGRDHRDMRVQVTIGVQQPDQVDTAVVAAELPRGRAEVTVVHGGLDVHDAEQGTTHVIAAAAVEAFLPIDGAEWRLAPPGPEPA